MLRDSIESVIMKYVVSFMSLFNKNSTQLDFIKRKHVFQPTLRGRKKAVRTLYIILWQASSWDKISASFISFAYAEPVNIMSCHSCDYFMLLGKGILFLVQLIIKAERFPWLVSQEEVRKRPCFLRRKQTAML